MVMVPEPLRVLTSPELERVLRSLLDLHEAAMFQTLKPLQQTLEQGLRPVSNSTTYAIAKMVRVHAANHLVLVVRSTCNESLTIQVIGHTSDSPGDSAGRINIGASQSLAAGGISAFLIDLVTVWMPYIGVTVASGATAPTSGAVTVEAFGERWVAGTRGS